jgi:hypothetical protein
LSRFEKLVNKFQSKPEPRDFRWGEFLTLMKGLGFTLDQSGGGSHCHFYLDSDVNKVIETFRPHPDSLLRTYQIKAIVAKLKEWGVI